jgi:hypothetical protein
MLLLLLLLLCASKQHATPPVNYFSSMSHGIQATDNAHGCCKHCGCQLEKKEKAAEDSSLKGLCSAQTCS